ncbi:hypothetical protein [Bradyrhizobium sp. dw_78]|uniref:hypothetical protein n=1 Tax=Bradyrhizobium sp. dw_78 TaxID=2719793 RepID=UPI001BD2736A|nr:hypothetical protein [Bradyrhizobium sp. dw_78]
MADGVQLSGVGVQLVPDKGGGGGQPSTPGGPNESIQFNNSGVLDGSTALTFNTETGQAIFGNRPAFGADTPWDSANFTPTDYFPASGGTIFGSVIVPALALSITGAAGSYRLVTITSSGSNRWQFGTDATAESGSNAGANFAIYRQSDAGTTIDAPFSITRSSGIATFSEIPQLPTASAGDSSTNGANTQFVNTAVAAGVGSPCIISRSYMGPSPAPVFTANEYVLNYFAVRPVIFPENFAGSVAVALGGPATATTVLPIELNGLVGTLTFGAGSNVGQFSTQPGATLTLQTHQSLGIIGPSVPDATLAGLTITMMGSYAN